MSDDFDAEIAALEAAHNKLPGTSLVEELQEAMDEVGEFVHNYADTEPAAAPASKSAKRVPKFPPDATEHMALLWRKP